MSNLIVNILIIKIKILYNNYKEKLKMNIIIENLIINLQILIFFYKYIVNYIIYNIYLY
jgi:hypothetical protein